MSSSEARRRDHMVEDQVVRRGIRDASLIAALRLVPRHLFVPEEVRHAAYRDEPLAIGSEQRIAEPFVVARAIEVASVRRGDRVLEIGAGSGYQAAVLAEMGAEVVGIELLPELVTRSGRVLAELGYRVALHVADGWDGWPERAPYQAILVSAAAPWISPTLLGQLAVGGRLVAPVGPEHLQELVVIERTPTSYERRRIMAVRFTPLTRAG